MRIGLRWSLRTVEVLAPPESEVSDRIQNLSVRRHDPHCRCPLHPAAFGGHAGELQLLAGEARSGLDQAHWRLLPGEFHLSCIPAYLGATLVECEYALQIRLR